MLKFFTKLFNIFKKLYPVYWGIEPNKTMDKAYYQEEKTYTYKIVEVGKDNILYYAYPISFGKIANIYVLDPSGDKKIVTSEWKLVVLKENYLYTTTVAAENQFTRTYKFTYSSADRP